LDFGGERTNGSRYVVGELIASGSGASEGMDGVDVIETDGTNCMNLQIEALELDVPNRINKTELRKGSGGPGKFRGGLGIIREYEILNGDVIFTHRGERHTYAAQGISAGGAGALARSVIYRADGSTEVINSKTIQKLEPGDRVVVETAGGGGYGNVRERNAQSVKADQLNRKC
ncbi:MAG: hydantoinase B/oxoprolinase family protein, partial [Pseudomonadota bacterium]|nr:hydantoinase B/oxoprolinase family protein [Pseudomonadota bacterium]